MRRKPLKVIVIVELLFNRVKQIHVKGNYKEMDKVLSQFPHGYTTRKLEDLRRLIKTGHEYRLELPNDQGLVIKESRI